jgi:hypothetical protein
VVAKAWGMERGLTTEGHRDFLVVEPFYILIVTVLMSVETWATVYLGHCVLKRKDFVVLKTNNNFKASKLKIRLRKKP